MKIGKTILRMNKFKSVIVDKGETLANCLAYIDLNPLRAGLVDRPEDYRWNSLGYLFYSKHEKKPKPIKGLDGIYSLKRLSEVI